MMKFSTLALALIAATPFVAAEYTCQNEAFFQMDDIKPSKEGLEHLQSVMVDSFEEAYKNNADIDMVSDKFEKFEIGQDATSIVTALRGGKDLRGRIYPRWISQGWWGCNMCEIDDDAALGASIDGPEFGVALTTSSEHKLWEKLFCEKARANKDFSSITGCTIVLSDCHNADYQSEFDVKGKGFVKQATKLFMNAN